MKNVSNHSPGIINTCAKFLGSIADKNLCIYLGNSLYFPYLNQWTVWIVTCCSPGALPTSGCWAPDAVLPSEAEPTLHGGHHDDPAHQHCWQGASPHDCLGKKASRYCLKGHGIYSNYRRTYIVFKVLQTLSKWDLLKYMTVLLIKRNTNQEQRFCWCAMLMIEGMICAYYLY